MKLRQNTLLALYSLLEFAADPQRQMPASEIAQKYEVSPHHLAKVLADNARLSGEVQAMTPRLEGLQRTVASLERQIEVLAAQPMPPKAVAGALRAVAKGEDANPGALPPMSADELKKHLDALPEEERGRLQLMAALRQPIPLGR